MKNKNEIKWLDRNLVTESDKETMLKKLTLRGWGYSKSDLKNEILKFKRAMDKGDVHATSLIFMELEEANYHDICGSLYRGDIDTAMELIG